MSLGATAFAWFIALALLSGCQLIAGDFEIDDSLVSAAEGACKTGEHRCNGEYLLECG